MAPAACERLLAWAAARGLADGHWLGNMWNEPEIVALPDCRYDVALVGDDVQPAGEIGRFELPRMGIAEVASSGDIALEAHGNEHFEMLFSSPSCAAERSATPLS